MRRAYTVQVYATVYVDDEDPSAPFEVVVGPELDTDFLVDDWDEDGWTDEEADAWHGFCYWLSQGVKPVWRFGDGTRTVRDVADSVHCDTQPTTITTNNHPEEGQS